MAKVIIRTEYPTSEEVAEILGLTKRRIEELKRLAAEVPGVKSPGFRGSHSGKVAQAQKRQFGAAAKLRKKAAAPKRTKKA